MKTYKLSPFSKIAMKTHKLSPFSLALTFTVAVALCVSAAPARAGNGTPSLCGDVDGGGSVVATDALLVLNTAVGSTSVPALVCPVDTCGDGVVTTGEDCDQGDLNGATCESQGMFGEGLACAAGCVFDTTACAQARYVDNGDGTVTDNQTGLVWEQKTDDDSVHDKDNTYSWSATGTAPDGQAFVNFLGTLNACVEAGGFPPADLSGGFAGHCDWRLPSIVELQTIVDTSVTDCGAGASCIDPIFGPTVNYNYWTATSFADNTSFAWFADFDVGQVEEGEKSGVFSVRAVRTGG